MYDNKENCLEKQEEELLKKIILSAVLAGIFFLLSACSVERIKEEKIKDLEFTVVAEDEIPEEMMEQIQEKKREKMRLTYLDGGYLYIAEGYGAQETSGYSVEVEEFYETENSLYIKTALWGPKKTEKIIEQETYPFVVIKTEENEKYVVFTE